MIQNNAKKMRNDVTTPHPTISALDQSLIENWSIYEHSLLEITKKIMFLVHQLNLN